jgi:nitroreductase
MILNTQIVDIIPQRFSCRTYQKRHIEEDARQSLVDFMARTRVGPLGSNHRFELIAATQADMTALRGLGTYGFIKGASGFIVGAMKDYQKNLEDFGYGMQAVILKATELGLGTCWLGGTFSKSNFARKVALQENETIPAVTSIGYMAETPRWVDGKIRQAAGSDQRLPWEKLFFDQNFDTPLAVDVRAEYAQALEMVRLAPSASNRQPWRIVRDDDRWHFYLRRSRGYRSNNYAKMLQLADLQRVDMGIAMCHFELTLRELGASGEWDVSDPGLDLPELVEYSVSWKNIA